MTHILDFIKFGLSHVKKDTVPVEAILPLPYSMVGSAGEWEYVYGTTGQTVTQALLDRKYTSYYKKNGWSKAEYAKVTKGWVAAKKTVCDCQGVEDYFSKADTNANGNYNNYCTSKGLCSAISRPFVIGEAVFNGSSTKKTHVGWCCGFTKHGEPLFMHERGIRYGFVVTTWSQFPWKYRGLMTKRYAYDTTVHEPTIKEFTFTRLLKYGCKGDDVKALKCALLEKGYGGLTLDNGNFYGSTRSVVKAFQRDNGLTVDGKAGSKTYTALGVKFKL